MPFDPKKQQTKQSEPKIDNIFGEKPEDKPLANKQSGNSNPERKTASAAKTSSATANLSPSDKMKDLLAKLNDLEGEDSVSDSDALKSQVGYTDTKEDLPVVPSSIPAVLNTQIAQYGHIEPEWHMVRNLPGYMQNGIRMLGRQLFGTFTNTDLESIQVLANVMGQGPNSQKELNVVASWAKENASPAGEGDIDFDNIMPGYKADIVQYSSNNIRLLFVKDEFGSYVYSWPESDSKNLGESIVAQSDQSESRANLVDYAKKQIAGGKTVDEVVRELFDAGKLNIFQIETFTKDLRGEKWN